MKKFFGAFFSAFFRTIATILGVIFALILIVIMITKPSMGNRSSGFEMARDHNWEVKPFSKTTPTILKINVSGAIGQHITSDDIKDVLYSSLSDLPQDQIKGILLNINSPGGLASDSDTIYRLLQEYKKRYHVSAYAFVDGICASGGYLVACAADKIYTTEPSVIGSIGVIVPTCFNVYGLMQKLGVDSLTVTSGKSKDTLNPFRPWTPDEASNIQQTANNYYERFMHIVLQNRPNLSRDALIAQGAEVYSGAYALDKHLIDGCVDLEGDALLKLAEDLQIQDNYQVVEFETKNWIKSFLNEETFFKKELKVQVPGTLPQELQGKFLFLYDPSVSSV